MSQSQGDFTPPVKAGYKSDGPFHRRNWRALTDFLRTNFVSTSHLQDGSVSGIKLQDLAVTDAKIESLSVDKLTAGQLQADVLLGAVIKTADSGQRVEIDQNGIRLNDGSQDTVNMPVSGDASFLGTVTAKSLNSEASTLSGPTQIDAGGSFVFTSGVADPSAAPTIAWTYDQLDLASPDDYTAFRGADYDATSSRVILVDTFDQVVVGINDSTGVEDWLWDYGTGGTGLFTFKPYGATRMGSYLYVAGTRTGPSTADKIFVDKISLNGSGVPTAVVAEYLANFPGAPWTNFDHIAGMTNDGTNVYVGWVKGSGDVLVTAFDTSLAIGSATTIDTGLETTNRKIYDVEYENVDGARWWVITSNNSTNVFRVYAYTSAPAALASENFDLPADSRGICFDGTVFRTVPNSPSFIRKHTTWRSSQTVEHVKYTWYQNAGGYETLASVQSHVTYVQRASLRVSWGAFPSTVDRARIYFLEDGSTSSPSTGGMKRQGTETGSVQTYTTYNSGGAADPSTNTFPNATPSTLVLPRLAAAPSSPVEGQLYHDTTLHKTRIWDGSAWNNLW